MQSSQGLPPTRGEVSRVLWVSLGCLLLSGCGGGAALVSASPDQPAVVMRLNEPASVNCQGAPRIPAVPSSGVVDVRRYGATPDDDTDDTEALQRAIDAADPGQWVVFPPGRYVHRSSLLVKRPQVTLWGPGATLHATNQADSAVFLLADEIRMYGFTLTGEATTRLTNSASGRIVATGEGAPGHYIRGLVIQNNRVVPVTEQVGLSTSNAGAGSGIFLMSVRDFTVAGNLVRRTMADGIHVTGGSRNGRVINNEVSQTGDDMIAVVSYIPSDWADHAASANWLRQLQGEHLVQDVWISGNQVSDSFWGRGLTVVGGRRVSIVNNRVSKSTYAAGILVAREQVNKTFGVDNVLVKDNLVVDVQTTVPGYLPQGDGFAELHASLRDAARTGQAGIEIHNVSRASDFQHEWQRQAVGVRNIVVTGNQILRSVRNGVRIGADSPVQSISDVLLRDNDVREAAVAPYQNRLKGDTSVVLACSGNQADGTAVVPEGCLMAAPVGQSAGAELTCSGFPAP